MKSDYITRAKRFCDMIAPFVCECRTPDDFETAMEDFNDRYHRAVKVMWGSTRVALISSDYVVKIDLLDLDEWAMQWGNCETEYEMYLKAKHDGFAHLLAPITPYYGCYIMPKVNMVGRAYCYWHNLSEAEEDWLTENIDDLHEDNYGARASHICVIDYACRANHF